MFKKEKKKAKEKLKHKRFGAKFVYRVGVEVKVLLNLSKFSFDDVKGEACEKKAEGRAKRKSCC